MIIHIGHLTVQTLRIVYKHQSMRKFFQNLGLVLRKKKPINHVLIDLQH